MDLSNLQKFWMHGATELHLQIEISPPISLDNGAVIHPKVHLKGFGATWGMLIFSDVEEIAAHQDAILESGYGFSCMSEPELDGIHDLGGLSELLDEWGSCK